MKIFALLKPTPIRVVFLLEWLFFIAFKIARGGLEYGPRLLAPLFPLLIFYLIACGLDILAKSRRGLAGFGMLVVLGLLWALVDQGLKAMIYLYLPEGSFITLLPQILHLRQAHNLYNSWIMEAFERQFLSRSALVIMSVVFLIAAFAIYRYYSATHRKSLWTDLALVFITAGLSSALLDQSVRGFTIDFIEIPGFVVADFKDLYLWLASSAVFAEVLDNPDVRLTTGPKESVAAARRFARYTIQDIRNVFGR
ncbi:MAG: signal peptidase II [Anaerolineales bacterium]|jgi:lipoprotein signal peptidase